MTNDEMVKALRDQGYQIEAPRKKMDWNALSPVQQKELRDNHEAFMGGVGDEVLD